MIGFILTHFGLVVPTFLGITIVAFAFIHILPGDPVLVIAGEHGLTPERYAQELRQLGLDRPLWEQYLSYLGGLLHGDLGASISTRRPVADEYLALFPATLELAVCAMAIAVAVGVPAGVLAAAYRGTTLDHATMSVALLGYSMPIFWWGLLLIILFSGILHWTPVSGRISPVYFFPTVTGSMLIDAALSGQSGAFGSAFSHLVLPSIVLATVPLAVIARQTRSAMLEVMGEDYVRTAWAKGLAPGRVIALHGFRNAMIPVVTSIGLQLGALLGGAVLTETIFAWPGVGKWMVDSIFRRDYPAVQGGLLLTACFVMLVNLLVDVLYGLINPRIRRV